MVGALVSSTISPCTLSGFYRSFDCHLNTQGVSILAHLHRVSLGEKKVSIDWQISCGPPLGEEPADPPQEDVVDCYTPEHGGYAVDVYLTDATENVPKPDPAGFTGLDHFETEHELQKSGHFPVPFDSYTFQVTAFAINPATNQSVDIARFSFFDSPRGSLDDAEVTTWTISTHNIDDGLEAVGNPRTLSVAIRYSNLTLALTTGMFATTWALTFASLYVTYSTVTKGMANLAIAMLHSTTALAITHIRNLYLCPPPFGRIIDTTSFFSQIIVLVICFVGTLLCVLVTPINASKWSVKDVWKVQRATQGTKRYP